MPIDYQRATREGRALRASLTRAVKSGDPDQVLRACKQAVAAWEAWGAWPDDWHRWQVALNDSRPWHDPLDLNDLD